MFQSIENYTIFFHAPDNNFFADDFEINSLDRIAPAVLRQATYGTIKFGIYYSLKKLLVPSPSKESLGINIVCGVTAGVVSSAIANPTDVVKVRLQSGRENFKNKGLVNAFLSIYRNEGLGGLWKVTRLNQQYSNMHYRVGKKNTLV